MQTKYLVIRLKSQSRYWKSLWEMESESADRKINSMCERRWYLAVPHKGRSLMYVWPLFSLLQTELLWRPGNFQGGSDFNKAVKIVKDTDVRRKV